MTKTTKKSGYESSAWFFFCIGALILLAMNSPAAAGGAFVAAGLCVVAEAICDAAEKFGARQAPGGHDSLEEPLVPGETRITREL